MNPESLLREQISKAVEQVFGQKVESLQLQPTNQEFEGSHTLVCFPLTKISRKGPEETAKLVGDHLIQNGAVVSRYNVVKGFLNLVLHDRVWIEVIQGIVKNQNYGKL